MQKGTGHLYVFEGPDGVGKSSVSEAFAHALETEGHSVWHTAFPGNEEGTLGKLVYEVHHNSSAYGIESLDPVSLQALHVAAHVDAIRQRILPRLREGVSVVLDRFWWSTFVYGLVGGVDRNSLDAMLSLERLHWQSAQPDMLFLIDRAEPFGPASSNWNELRQTYLRYAKNEEHPYPVEVMTNDGTLRQTVDEVVAAVVL